MTNLLKDVRTDRSLQTGFLLLTASVLLYGTTTLYTGRSQNLIPSLFFIHYGLAVGYFIFLAFQKQLRLLSLFSKNCMPYHIILLLLFNVSAYSLNQTLHVFQNSVDWLTIFLMVENGLLLLYLVLPGISKVLASVLLFCFIPAFVFNCYQFLVVTPYLLPGIIASLFLGISLHVLVPLFYMIALCRIMARLTAVGADWKPVALSVACCILIIGTYVIGFGRINNKIVAVHHRLLMPGSSGELPQWVRYAQSLPDDYFTEKALQSGMVYQELTGWDSFFSLGLRYENTRFHDPLIAIGSFINGKIELDATARMRILNALYNMRHESADRFWSGLNLRTSNVVTNVQLYPSYRMAYTELILTIRNEKYGRQSGWFNQEEALYTFQLPEGGAVSSLSLWIGGIEARARLTTKGKAVEAYNTIVGREARDPSVVYWMEGNKIRVRVFPCTPEKDRQFKLGITAPLMYEDGQLIYNSITFKGPDCKGANSSVNILMQNSSAVPEAPFSLERSGNTYFRTGTYQADWTISTKAPPLAKAPFSFLGNSYHIQQLPETYDYFRPENLYLDLHAGWDISDMRGLAEVFSGKQFHVYNFHTGSMELVDAEDIITAIKDEELPEFSLFPFHKIQFPDRSIVITKGNRNTPNLSDLREAPFGKSLFAFLSGNPPVKVFNLHNVPSGYIQSLKEFKVLQYAHGPVHKLEALLKTGRFPVTIATAGAVAIKPAKMMIVKTRQAAGSSSAPDHLFRLFSYNQVMKEIGDNYFEDDYINDEVAGIAAAGNVVTPVSSLIVLETLEDYKRFDISENKDSLGNAAIASSGAVPEPHEWAMIIMGFLFLVWLWYAKTGSKVSL